MFEKKILDALLKKIHRGALRVRYWDSEIRRYGNGKPYFTITITSPAVIRSMLGSLTLGFGEAYMKGLIKIDGRLENVGRLASENKPAFRKWRFTQMMRGTSPNYKALQKQQVQHHYDLGNEFYELWLDKSLTYSCAYFRSLDDTLEQAQQQKVEHLLRKLQLSPDHRVLDIGSGWGTLLITAAKRYGITGLGVTLSREQHTYSVAAAKAAGVADKVTFELRNYQDLSSEDGMFDRIISVGMFEHVGAGNQDIYFKTVDSLLVDGGISVLHTITTQLEAKPDAWIDKYIFPGGYLPTNKKIISNFPKYGFRLLDYENLRLHYALTLEEWRRRLHSHRVRIEHMYDQQFYRMWDLWLASSAAGFRYGDLDLGQFVFSKGVNNDLPLTREFLYTHE